ncbi:WGR domain-containing protein [Brucella sp. NBRC 113783]|uniref:WGR domain-containing protein n=1 Tax=Brucella/Ochrobactrum group TaxID=2826938 RepID=UPI00333E6467
MWLPLRFDQKTPASQGGGERSGTTGQVMLQHFEYEMEAVQMFLTLARKKKTRGDISRRFSHYSSV